jgi:hypothetical protein
MSQPVSWLRQAIHKATRPKQSIIGVLKQQLGGPQAGRSMKVVHASDVTKTDFCPKKWALFDLFEKQAPTDTVATAMDVTYRMGLVTESLLIEEWAGDAVVGNWRCRYCYETRSMTPKPGGHCPGGSRKHWWQHVQMVVEAPEYGIQGGIDALFNIGAPQLVVTELKTMNPDDFEKILLPLPEHRLRTNLYLWILEQSQHPHREKICISEARVLYISRGYGKLNAEWNEILPFKEFVVKRNDADLSEFLKRAAALKVFRQSGLMPHGICATALDKFAKNCSVCQPCFSGQYPAGKYPPSPEG